MEAGIRPDAARPDAGSAPWVAVLAGSDANGPAKVAVAGDGSIYLAVGFNGTLFCSATYTSADSGILVVALTASGTMRWCKLLDGPAQDNLGGIATDADSTLWVAGTFRDTLGLGATLVQSKGVDDVFLARYDADGSARSLLAFGGSSKETLGGIAVASNKTVYLVGGFEGNFQFGTNTISSAGGTDAFIAQVGPNGQEWATAVASGVGLDRATTIALGGDQFYVAGYFSEIAKVGGLTVTSAGSTDVFLSAWKTSGTVPTPLWTQVLGGANASEGAVIAASPTRVILANHFYGSQTVGTLTFTSAGLTDNSVTSYSASGELQWAQHLSSLYHVFVNGIAVRDDGSTIVVGESNGTLTCDKHTKGLNSDAFVVSLAADGSCARIDSWGGSGFDKALSVSVGPDGPLVAGTFENAVVFPNGTRLVAAKRSYFLVSLP